MCLVWREMSRFGQSDAEGEHEEAEASADQHVRGFEPTLGLFILYISRRC
jgi:hypothetical protein